MDGDLFFSADGSRAIDVRALGLVTRRGLASVVWLYYPRWVLWSACLLLIVANVFNIGADLGGLAEATE